MGDDGHSARALGVRNSRSVKRRQADPEHSRGGFYSVGHSGQRAGSESSPAPSQLSELDGMASPLCALAFLHLQDGIHDCTCITGLS